MILHLVAKTAWDARQATPDQPYVPDAFAKDGFIHCTQGDDLLLQVANRFYKTMPGDILVLSIDEAKVKAPVKWEAAQEPTPAQPTTASASPAYVPSATSASNIVPPEAKAEFGEAATAGVNSASATPAASVPSVPASTGPLFPHIYGPLNRDAIVGMRRLLRAADGTFSGYAPLEQAPAGMNLKSPSQLANELVDATGDFSDALSRYKDRIEARMDEIDKNIKDKLG